MTEIGYFGGLIKSLSAITTVPPAGPMFFYTAAKTTPYLFISKLLVPKLEVISQTRVYP